VAAARAPGAGDPRAWKDLTMPAEHAQEQLWRTGRASRLELCPRTGTRPLPPASGDSIGTAHPLLFQEVAPDGRWTVLCQARADTDGDGKIAVGLGQHGEPYGDAVRPYLVVGAGPGLATDEVLASDPSSRYVALREGACLELVDTRARTVTTLPDADLRAGDAVFGPSRGASFDAAGQQLAYLRGGSPRGRVVVRRLVDGAEVEIDPGPGNLYRAPLDPGGRWVVLELAQGPWPSYKTSLADRTCRGPALSWSVWGRKGGTLVREVVPAAGGPPRDVPGLVRPFGADFLVREPSGELAVVAETGKKVRTLVPAHCRGRLLHADAARAWHWSSVRTTGQTSPGASSSTARAAR
jgi:hypothetical protein